MTIAGGLIGFLAFSLLLSAKSDSKLTDLYEVYFYKSTTASKDLKWKKDKDGDLFTFRSIENQKHKLKIIFDDGNFLIVPSVLSLIMQEKGIVTSIDIWPFQDAYEPDRTVVELNHYLNERVFGLSRSVVNQFAKTIHRNIIISNHVERAVVNGKNSSLEIGFKYDLTQPLEGPKLYFPILYFYKETHQ